MRIQIEHNNVRVELELEEYVNQITSPRQAALSCYNLLKTVGFLDIDKYFNISSLYELPDFDKMIRSGSMEGKLDRGDKDLEPIKVKTRPDLDFYGKSEDINEECYDEDLRLAE